MDPISRPIFIVGPPQSGSTYLHQALGQLSEVWALDARARGVFDHAEELRPAARGHDSNRRAALDATAETAERMRRELRDLVTDAPEPKQPARRILDAAPRHSLRVPFLDAIFPDAFFVYVYREPREAIASMAAAWASGSYVTHPKLPDWPGPPWSLLLVPGWRELAGCELTEIVTTQWATTTRILLEDLEGLPPERWSVVDYAALAADPQPQLERLCGFLGLEWRGDADPGEAAAHVVSPSAAARSETSERLEAFLPRSIGLAERARDLLAEPVSRRPTATPDAASPLRSAYTGSVTRLLDQLGGSLVATTYKTGKLVCVRRDGPRVNTHFRNLPRPAAVATTADGIAVATRGEVWRYRDSAEALVKLDGARPYDACLVPRSRHLTGELGVRDLAEAGGELWLAATRFSCLATLDDEHSFVPRWRPPFVSELAGEDRCHLSGMAIAGGRPAFVTAFAATDAADGWRVQGPHAGCAIEVDSGEIVAGDLCLPHSPRWHDDRLWLLESGEGALCVIDPTDGSKEVVARLPGFARGLALVGRVALIGLSSLRESASLGPLPVAERFEEHFCGLWAIDTESGATRAYLRFDAEVPELLGVAFLPGLRFPEIADPGGDAALGSFTLP